MSIILSFVFGYLISHIYEQITLSITKRIKVSGLIIFDYRLHHSLYGLIATIIAIVFYNPSTSLLIISAGLGNIVQHYCSGDGLVFITKENK